MLCICYPVLFNIIKIKILLELSSEINAINLIFANTLDFSMQKINIGAQKIDELIIEVFEMVMVGFLL